MLYVCMYVIMVVLVDDDDDNLLFMNLDDCLLFVLPFTYR